VVGVTAMTILFLLCSGLGYAAFGDNTPGNILTGFTEPFWLVALGNGCIIMHMIGAYQVGSLFFQNFNFFFIFQNYATHLFNLIPNFIEIYAFNPCHYICLVE